MSDLIKTRSFPDGFIFLELDNEAPERARPFWGCLHDMLRFQKFLQRPNSPSWSLSTPGLQNKHGTGEVFRVPNAKTKCEKHFSGAGFKVKKITRYLQIASTQACGNFMVGPCRGGRARLLLKLSPIGPIWCGSDVTTR